MTAGPFHSNHNVNRQEDSRAQDEAARSKVKTANRQLYDAIAGAYEEIDGRRSTELQAWLRTKLGNLRQRTQGGRLLDIGTGSGLVTRCAEGLFALRVGTDISSAILRVNAHAFDAGLVADVDHLPFLDGSFDVVTCFAVLHHLYSFENLVSEIARVLKPGGIFYSDHDMDCVFRDRFRPLLTMYRRMRKAERNYCRISSSITAELYNFAEWHQNGIDTAGLVRLLEGKGLSVEARFHWFGLNRITDQFFRTRFFGRGWAPLVCIIGKKEMR